MKNPIMATMAITLILLVTCTGCMNTPQPAPAPLTPAATTAPAATTVPVATSTPEHLQTLPPGQQVDLQLTKDRTYSEIHLLYNGGGGEMFIQSVRMRVTRSDGQVIEQVMSNGKKPGRGDEIVVQGTRGSDRCEVYVTSAGTTYNVKDESLVIGGAYQGN
jgi:ABC-type transport system substrate-binding protein